MGFRIGFIVVAGIGVRHGVILGIGRKLCWWAFFGGVVGQVFEPRVTSVGCGRVQPFFAASCRGGSASKESHAVSSWCERWLALSVMSVITASNNLLASARVRGLWLLVPLLSRRLDIHPLKFVVVAQIDQACRKCYRFW